MQAIFDSWKTLIFRYASRFWTSPSTKKENSRKFPSSVARQTVCANPFEEKIFNGLLTENDFQTQVFARLDESEHS
ncbi:MAG: hypothetical protein P8X90_07275, partial [Desulfobacterales bacterium]